MTLARRKRVRTVIVHCGSLCRIVRHLPFQPPIPGRPRKLVKHWPFVVLGMGMFAVGVYIVGHGFVAGLVAARIVEATGNLLLDRAFVGG